MDFKSTPWSVQEDSIDFFELGMGNVAPNRKVVCFGHFLTIEDRLNVERMHRNHLKGRFEFGCISSCRNRHPDISNTTSVTCSCC